MMANNQSRPKPATVEKEIKTYNPTKSKVGKIILVILAAGMFIATLMAAIIGIIEYFK